MKRSVLLFDDDLLIIINALSDKAASYRDLAADISKAIADGKAHPSYRLLAELFDRQAENAERIRGYLAAYV